MATPPSNPSREQNTSLPPRRGQIKARIFESLVETVVSMASKAREALSRNGREGGGGGGSSASTTPPPSGDNSDGYSDIS